MYTAHMPWKYWARRQKTCPQYFLYSWNPHSFGDPMKTWLGKLFTNCSSIARPCSHNNRTKTQRQPEKFRAHLQKSAQQKTFWGGCFFFTLAVTRSAQCPSAAKGLIKNSSNFLVILKVRQKRVPTLTVLVLQFSPTLLLGIFLLLLFYQLRQITWEMGAFLLLGTQQESKAPSKGKDPRCRVFCWALFRRWALNFPVILSTREEDF